MLVVKGAEAEQVRAAPLEYDALLFHQTLHGNLLLQPLDIFFGDTELDRLAVAAH